MPQRLHALVACASLVVLPELATAQPAARAVPVTRTASMAAGSVHGIVRDDVGAAVGGVSVVALGATMASARSDADGRFRLALAPGDYILRASRDGYVSTFREPVRVQTSTRLERNIVMVRASAAPEYLIASTAPVQPVQPRDPSLEPVGLAGPHAHSELAWRLRHLRRTILRDGGAPGSAGSALGDDVSTDAFRPDQSLLDRAFIGSARLAHAFFADADFTGHVNFLTSSSLPHGAGWRPDDWSGGIALVAVGASVGEYGDWAVRGAVRAGDRSSWVMLGEYRGRPEMTHALHVGMSYSVQGDLGASATRRRWGAEARSVSGVFGYDRWRVVPGVELNYGLRLDRYDYVVPDDRISPRVGARVEVLPRTRVTASAAQHVVAPGGNEFLPPESGGLWLPPERTFSPLSRDHDFRAGRVRHAEVGLEREFGPEDRPATVAVRHFVQTSANQIATLFGTGAWQTTGHYRVSSPGDVDLRGWAVGVSGAVDSRVDVAVDYTVGSAAWRGVPASASLGRLAPGAVRAGNERVHDVTVHVRADIPESDTRVSFAWRANTAFAPALADGATPGLAGRFDMEIHQGLPYRPLPGSQLEVLLAMRNLFRDARAEGSFYDELLTVAPPLRLMGGVRVRF